LIPFSASHAFTHLAAPPFFVTAPGTYLAGAIFCGIDQSFLILTRKHRPDTAGHQLVPFSYDTTILTKGDLDIGLAPSMSLPRRRGNNSRMTV